MESNAIYTTSDAGLSRFFGKIYGLVGMGVGLSAVISYLMLFPLSHVFVNILMNYSWVYMAALFLEFGLVFLASGAARRNTPAALPLFLVYSALNGFTLSFIIVQYTQAIVFQAFLSTAIFFSFLFFEPLAVSSKPLFVCLILMSQSDYLSFSLLLM